LATIVAVALAVTVTLPLPWALLLAVVVLALCLSLIWQARRSYRGQHSFDGEHWRWDDQIIQPILAKFYGNRGLLLRFRLSDRRASVGWLITASEQSSDTVRRLRLLVRTGQFVPAGLD
jgi:hypothetical protein